MGPFGCVYASRNGGLPSVWRTICACAPSLGVFGRDLHANQANGSVGGCLCLWELVWHASIKFALFARPGFVRAHSRAQDQRCLRPSNLFRSDLPQNRANGAVTTCRRSFTPVDTCSIRIHYVYAIRMGLFWLSDTCAGLRAPFVMLSAGA